MKQSFSKQFGELFEHSFVFRIALAAVLSATLVLATTSPRERLLAPPPGLETGVDHGVDVILDKVDEFLNPEPDS